MNCQNTKAVNLKKELIQYGLMEVMRIGQGKSDRLYIIQLEYTNEDIYKATTTMKISKMTNFQVRSVREQVWRSQEPLSHKRIPKIRILKFRKVED